MSGSKDSNSTKSSEAKIGANYGKSALDSPNHSGKGTQLLATFKNKKFENARLQSEDLARRLREQIHEELKDALPELSDAVSHLHLTPL